MHRLLCAIAVIGLTPLTSVAQNAGDDASASRITVQMSRGITSSDQLPSQELIRARKALAAKKSIPTSQMRQLADLGDGFAALRYAQWLEKQGEEVKASDVAHYFGIAAATGRGGSITGVIRMLDRLGPDELSPARSKLLKDVVMAYAMAGNSHAVDAITRYQLRRAPFGTLDAEVVEILQNAEGEGAAELALQTALTILRQVDPSKDDMLRAQSYLLVAENAASLETKMVATNLSNVLTARLDQLPAPAAAPENTALVSDPAAPDDTTPAAAQPAAMEDEPSVVQPENSTEVTQ